MSVVYQCDRCGTCEPAAKPKNNLSNAFSLTLPSPSMEVVVCPPEGWTKAAGTKDLCPECTTALGEFLGGKALKGEV